MGGGCEIDLKKDLAKDRVGVAEAWAVGEGRTLGPVGGAFFIPLDGDIEIGIPAESRVGDSIGGGMVVFVDSTGSTGSCDPDKGG